MQGYGAWVQLSVFQCRLSRRRHANLVARLDGMIDHAEDHVVLVDISLADGVAPSRRESGEEVPGRAPGTGDRLTRCLAAPERALRCRRDAGGALESG